MFTVNIRGILLFFSYCQKHRAVSEWAVS